jgi:hypothetical protein
MYHRVRHSLNAAHDTPENVPVDATSMDLAGFATATAAPAEIRVIVEGFADRESVGPSIPSER